MAVNQLKAGALLSYVSIGLNNIIGLLYTPFMLRMMGQTEYGLYALVASVVSYLTVLDLGFGNAVIRYTAKYRAEGKVREQYEMFGMFFLVYVVIGFIALIVGGILCCNVDTLFDRTMSVTELHKIRIMMILMIVNIAFTFPMSIWGSIVTAYEQFIFSKLVNIVRVILNPIAMIVMLYMGYRAIGMVVVTTLFNVATLLVNWWYCRYRLHVHIRFGHFQWGFFKEVSVYSFWIFLNAIMDRIYWSTGQFVLGMFRGAREVAIYAVAIQLHNIYMGFSLAIFGVLLPKVTKMVALQSSNKEISDLFIRVGRIQYAILVFILLGFILFGKYFLYFWAGAGYVGAYEIALCFFIPFTVPLMQNTGTVILQAQNRLSFRSIIYVLIALVSFCVSIPLAKLYGGLGCAVATASCVLLGHVLIMNIYYKRVLHIDIVDFWRNISQMSIVPIGIGGCFWGGMLFWEPNTIAKLIGEMLLFVACYLPLFWKFSLNSYEKGLVMGPLKQCLDKLRKKYNTI